MKIYDWNVIWNNIEAIQNLIKSRQTSQFKKLYWFKNLGLNFDFEDENHPAKKIQSILNIFSFFTSYSLSNIYWRKCWIRMDQLLRWVRELWMELRSEKKFKIILIFSLGGFEIFRKPKYLDEGWTRLANSEEWKFVGVVFALH